MKFFLTISLIAASIAMEAQSAYQYTVNLVDVKDDKVTVTLEPPVLTETEIDFLFPAMVPGTYEIYNFGRFISGFKAEGKDGKVINVKQLDANTYRISPANAVSRISYQVDDTFDPCNLPGTKENIIFEPGGSNFEADKNFSFNTHCLFGYFKAHSQSDFKIQFIKPEGFFPATGHSDIRIGKQSDEFRISGYHALADAPILYAKPDTSTIQVANTSVLVASYSPNKQITANFIAGTLKELLYAQGDYLGGTLPVDKYAFLFYFNDKAPLSGGHGALEHNYSSFYVMPEYDSLAMQQQLRDVCAHEFFHIVTPLTIHAKEIGEFDFNHPEMSEHLWLYEGMTEYAAHHAQVKAGIIEMNDFLNTMMQKYENSVENYNDTMSFTYMSKHVLEKKIHKQYNNVYEKGAVIGMCLDILLRDLSNGQYGTQLLMKDLGKKYGKEKSFKDADLFNDIEAFTFPEVGTFLRKHVGGNIPLPMEDILLRVGVIFKKEESRMEYTLGNPDLDYNETTRRLVVVGTKNLDAFGKALKFKRGDEFKSLNGKNIQIETLRETVNTYFEDVREGSITTIVVYRKGLFGKYKEKTLSAKARQIEVVRKNQLSIAPEISEKQKETMRSWLNI